MKRFIKTIIVAIVISHGITTFAYDPSGKSEITQNPSDPKYYNNNITENKLISSDKAVADWANKNPDAVNAIIEMNGGQCGNSCYNDMKKQQSSQTNGQSSIVVFTTEPVPGAQCVCEAEGNGNVKGASSCGGSVQTRKYKCTTQPGMLGFQEIFAKIIRYIVNITLLLGVLAVVGLGIAWSLAGGEDVKAKSTIKTWAINIIIGLLILFLFRYILMFLAPWVYV